MDHSKYEVGVKIVEAAQASAALARENVGASQRDSQLVELVSKLDKEAIDEQLKLRYGDIGELHALVRALFRAHNARRNMKAKAIVINSILGALGNGTLGDGPRQPFDALMSTIGAEFASPPMDAGLAQKLLKNIVKVAAKAAGGGRAALLIPPLLEHLESMSSVPSAGARLSDVGGSSGSVAGSSRGGEAAPSAMSGRDYAYAQLCEFVRHEWPSETLVLIASACHEMPQLDVRQPSLLVDKICLELRKAPIALVPAVVYELLVFAVKGPRDAVVRALVELFTLMDTDGWHGGAGGEACDAHALADAQSTLMRQFQDVVTQDQALGAAILKQTNALCGTTFGLALLLMLAESERFGEKVLPALRKTVVNALRSESRTAVCTLPELRQLANERVLEANVTCATLYRIVEQSAEYWDMSVKGLVLLGTTLLDVPRSSDADTALRAARTGRTLLLRLFAVHSMVRINVLDKCVEHIAAQSVHDSCVHYVRLLRSIVAQHAGAFVSRGADPALLQQCRLLLESAEHLPLALGTELITSLVPFALLDGAFRQRFVVVMRKYFMCADVAPRLVALRGLLQLAYLIQTRIHESEKGGQARVAARVTEEMRELNELSFEIVGFLRRALSHQAEVRAELYASIERMAAQPQCASLMNAVAGILVDHLHRYVTELPNTQTDSVEMSLGNDDEEGGDKQAAAAAAPMFRAAKLISMIDRCFDEHHADRQLLPPLMEPLDKLIGAASKCLYTWIERREAARRARAANNDDEAVDERQRQDDMDFKHFGMQLYGLLSAMVRRVQALDNDTLAMVDDSMCDSSKVGEHHAHRFALLLRTFDAIFEHQMLFACDGQERSERQLSGSEGETDAAMVARAKASLGTFGILGELLDDAREKHERTLAEADRDEAGGDADADASDEAADADEPAKKRAKKTKRKGTKRKKVSGGGALGSSLLSGSNEHDELMSFHGVSAHGALAVLRMASVAEPPAVEGALFTQRSAASLRRLSQLIRGNVRLRAHVLVCMRRHLRTMLAVQRDALCAMPADMAPEMRVTLAPPEMRWLGMTRMHSFDCGVDDAPSMPPEDAVKEEASCEREWTPIGWTLSALPVLWQTTFGGGGGGDDDEFENEEKVPQECGDETLLKVKLDVLDAALEFVLDVPGLPLAELLGVLDQCEGDAMEEAEEEALPAMRLYKHVRRLQRRLRKEMEANAVAESRALVRIMERLYTYGGYLLLDPIASQTRVPLRGSHKFFDSVLTEMAVADERLLQAIVSLWLRIVSCMMNHEEGSNSLSRRALLRFGKDVMTVSGRLVPRHSDEEKPKMESVQKAMCAPLQLLLVRHADHVLESIDWALDALKSGAGSQPLSEAQMAVAVAAKEGGDGGGGKENAAGQARERASEAALRAADERRAEAADSVLRSYEALCLRAYVVVTLVYRLLQTALSPNASDMCMRTLVRLYKVLDRVTRLYMQRKMPPSEPFVKMIDACGSYVSPNLNAFLAHAEQSASGKPGQNAEADDDALAENGEPERKKPKKKGKKTRGNAVRMRRQEQTVPVLMQLCARLEVTLMQYGKQVGSDLMGKFPSDHKGRMFNIDQGKLGQLVKQSEERENTIESEGL